MEENENIEGDREEIYANAVRAGKRTYFFDVRKTRGEDYYLTITESKRKYNDDGTFFYQKHKIFLYKEDFEKFSNALTDSIKKIISLKNEHEAGMVDKITNNFTDVNFEDLGGDARANGTSTDTE
ncbi:MAG: PUR family DNA/RNA-binding protein [Flavobacteriales bacterium]|nr:PUR family DNA/RNA-binding protein [Flavobacteriales bacterium]